MKVFLLWEVRPEPLGSENGLCDFRQLSLQIWDHIFTPEPTETCVNVSKQNPLCRTHIATGRVSDQCATVRDSTVKRGDWPFGTFSPTDTISFLSKCHPSLESQIPTATSPSLLFGICFQFFFFLPSSVNLSLIEMHQGLPPSLPPESARSAYSFPLPSSQKAILGVPRRCSRAGEPKPRSESHRAT